MPARRSLVPGGRPHGKTRLRSNDETVTFAFQPAPSDFLGATDQGQIGSHGVGVRSIDEVHADVCRLVENRGRNVLVRLFAEGRRSDAKAGDAESSPAKFCELHEKLLKVTR